MENKYAFLWQWMLPGALLLSLVVSWLLGTFFGNPQAARTLEISTLIFGSLPLFYQTLATFAHKRLGIDIIALLAIVTSLLLGQYLVGVVILLMLSTGEALERFAIQRAKREITSLLEHMPDTAQKKQGAVLQEIPVDNIVVGDVLVIRPGEVIPVDGEVIKGVSNVDEAALTGESIPQEKSPGMHVMSGSVNQGILFEIRATATTQDSKYAQIIRLVREAESKEAPFVRMADRYSARFTLITLLFASLAWALSQDPIRVLAVLVVATPCPLILATPIAFASGISRAAKRGIMIKHGGALEALGRARSFVFDKTGTLTLGTPRVTHIHSYGSDPEAALRIAASLEQLSTHILAESLTAYTKEKNIALSYPKHFEETLGKGVCGILEGARYFLGSLSYIESKGIRPSQEILLRHQSLGNLGVIVAYLATDTKIMADIHFSDTVRPEVKSLFRNLRTLGIQNMLMLTGDKRHVAETIAREAGIAAFKAECLPEDKIRQVEKLQKTSGPVVMVGDGINDAPALVAADVGIALGTRGATASSEAGDIVITVNNVERVGEALALGKRVLSVAKQGIFLGIGLSIFLMILAALGYVPPVLGAILQEVIDVLAIGNALRVHGKLP